MLLPTLRGALRPRAHLRCRYAPMVPQNVSKCRQVCITRRCCRIPRMRGCNHLPPCHPASLCGSCEMKTLFKNNRGAAAVEFALGIMPITVFMVGNMMTAYVLWIDNILYFAVDYAARCGAIQSTTAPCYGPGLANMKRTADALFLVSGATYT